MGAYAHAVELFDAVVLNQPAIRAMPRWTFSWWRSELSGRLAIRLLKGHHFVGQTTHDARGIEIEVEIAAGIELGGDSAEAVLRRGSWCGLGLRHWRRRRGLLFFSPPPGKPNARAAMRKESGRNEEGKEGIFIRSFL